MNTRRTCLRCARTMKFVQFWVTLCLCSVEVLHVSGSITVKFPNKDPLYVAPGRTLVLEAQFQLQQNDRIIFLTWERKNSDGEVRVANGNKANNNRTFVEKNGALLRIKGVINSDYGDYKITVTADNGDQMSDSRQVLKITNPPAASLAMQCSVPTHRAQWDSPSFSWQVDGISITNETAELSQDSSQLSLIKLGRNYTCVTDSSQGTSKVEVHMKELTPEPVQCSCTVWIIFVVILIVFIVILVAVLIKMYLDLRSTGHRREPKDYNSPLNERH